MKHNTVIQWSEAIQFAIESEAKQKIDKSHYLQEFKENDLSMLDAADIHFYAEMTGIDANDLRRLHPQKDTALLLHSFEGDDTDDIMDFF